MLPNFMLRWDKSFAPLKTWSKFILTSDEAFESKYGVRPIKTKTYNGTLKVDLYHFGQRKQTPRGKNRKVNSWGERRTVIKRDIKNQFDSDEAKPWLLGQVIRKNEEVEAGVLPEDSILTNTSNSTVKKSKPTSLKLVSLRRTSFPLKTVRKWSKKLVNQVNLLDQVDDSDRSGARKRTGTRCA